MTDLLATIFLNPVLLDRRSQLLLLFPLCLAISIVYKTTRCREIREVPLATLATWITIILGMFAVGAALMLLYELAA